MIRILFILCFALKISNSIAQTDTSVLSTETKIILNQFKDLKTVYSDCISIDCRTVPEYVNYLELRKKVTVDELVMIFNSHNNSIKIYAYKALLERKSDTIIPLLKSMKNNSDEIMYFSGCSNGKQSQRMLLKDWSIILIKKDSFLSRTKRKELKQIIEED